MSQMIERVAKVLSPQSWNALGTPCDTKAKKKRRDVSLDYAKRCIQAMREPTNEMCYAGLALDTPRLTYQSMIDKALE